MDIHSDDSYIRKIRNELRTNLAQYPLLEFYLGPSLIQRVKMDNWYENRVIRYIIRQAKWAQRLESIFQETSLDTVENFEETFSDLQGSQADYDSHLFDALAEVRLIRYARQDGYNNIKKLKRKHGIMTPDFSMEKGGQFILAEAKHFRERDYFLDFIQDRIEGLVLKMDRLKEFGLHVESGEKYEIVRDDLLATNDKERKSIVDSAREDLPKGFLARWERELEAKPKFRANISGISFTITRYEAPKSVTLSQIYGGNPDESFIKMLQKLKGNFEKALRQIKDYLPYCTTLPSRAIVLFSGMDPSPREWGMFWEVLCDNGGQWAWDEVRKIRCNASAIVSMPFDLIVGQGTPLEYRPFPWKREEYK